MIHCGKQDSERTVSIQVKGKASASYPGKSQ